MNRRYYWPGRQSGLELDQTTTFPLPPTRCKLLLSLQGKVFLSRSSIGWCIEPITIHWYDWRESSWKARAHLNEAPPLLRTREDFRFFSATKWVSCCPQPLQRSDIASLNAKMRYCTSERSAIRRQPQAEGQIWLQATTCPARKTWSSPSKEKLWWWLISP